MKPTRIDRSGLDFEADDTAVSVRLEAPGGYEAEIVFRLSPDELTRFRQGECLAATHHLLACYFLPAVARFHVLLTGPDFPA
jgi:hypothetical protein